MSIYKKYFFACFTALFIVVFAGSVSAEKIAGKFNGQNITVNYDGALKDGTMLYNDDKSIPADGNYTFKEGNLTLVVYGGKVVYIDEPQMATEFEQNGKIYIVVTVLSLVFLGLIIYLGLMGSKLSKLEKQAGIKK